MLHGFGMSVEYNRVMRVESQIEATVLQRMEDDGGMYTGCPKKSGVLVWNFNF